MSKNAEKRIGPEHKELSSMGHSFSLSFLGPLDEGPASQASSSLLGSQEDLAPSPTAAFQSPGRQGVWWWRGWTQTVQLQLLAVWPADYSPL